MTTTTDREAFCEVPGCGVKAHGRGLCRIHYDETRYLETTGRNPEAEAAARREQAIEAELRLGCAPSWQSPNAPMFDSDDDRREAWDVRRDELMRECLEPPFIPGNRPAAWWDYEAGRPQQFKPYPMEPPPGEPRWGMEHGRLLDDHDIEPVAWMAANGYLAQVEIDHIRDRALEAAARVGTDREQMMNKCVSKDRSAVRLAIRVDKALGEPVGDYGPDEPLYEDTWRK